MSADLLPGPTWFVGCGNMAGAMVEGWRSAGVELSQAVAIRPSGKPVEGVRTVQSVGEAGRPPKLAILGFKPQKLDEIAPELAPRLSAQTVVISILAGVEAESLRSRFPGAAAIVRAMPNLPVAVRRGVVGLYSADADDALRQQLRQLFSVLGMVAWTASEAELAAIGSVAGAGPAYVARFIAALAKAGRGARPRSRHRLDGGARDGARNRLAGRGQRREHGRHRPPGREPERNHRSRALTCSTATMFSTR